MVINVNFLAAQKVGDSISMEQSKLNVIIKMINTTINKIRHTEINESFVGVENKDGISLDDLIISIEDLLKSGLTKDQIKKDILPNLGFDINTFPIEIMNLLN